MSSASRILATSERAPRESREVHVLLAEALSRLQPNAFFGVIGEDTAVLTGCLGESVPYYAARHEGAAVGMADGYSRATESLSVCFVTRGPGFTNALTAVRTAILSQRSRLLIVTGEKPTKRWYLPDPKLADQRTLAAGIGLGYFEAHEAVHVMDALRDAHASAAACKPAVLAIAANVFSEIANLRPHELSPLVPEPDDRLSVRHPSDADVTSIVSALERSQRPLVLAGRGAMANPEAAGLLARLADRAGALLGTSLPARDLFIDHPFNVGVVGGFASDPAAPLLREVDCVIGFGVSLSDFTTASQTLFSDATTVLVEVDPTRIGVHYDADISVLGDAATTAAAILAALPRGASANRFRTAEAEAQLARPLLDEQDLTTAKGLDPRTVASLIDEFLPERRNVVSDNGGFMSAPARYVRTSGVGSSFFVGDFAAVGGGLGPGLGVALARAAEATVLFIGDGGLMFALTDLETAARLRIPLVIVVMNDGGFGAERGVLSRAGTSTSWADYADVDFAAVARALGIEAGTVRSREDLLAQRKALSRRDSPLLLDCKIRPDYVVPRVSGNSPT